MTKNSFNLKEIWPLLKQTGKEFTSTQDPFQLSASVAFYAIFSLPALMLIIITITSAVFDKKAVEARISGEFSETLGQGAGRQLTTMIENAAQTESGTLGTIIGIATLLFGATAVFIYLQKALNVIWDVRADPNTSSIKKLIFDRLTSFSFIIVFGFLLLISLLLTTGLSALQDYFLSIMPDFLVYLFTILHYLLTFVVVSFLFAIIFRFLPDAKIQWRSVWVGAVITTVLFFIGKIGLSIYFGEAEPGSNYGVAGTIILMLLWVNYTCLILFFGAEFTQVYARRYGQRIEPDDFSVRRSYNKK